MPKSEVSKRDGKKHALGLIVSCPKCEDGLLRKIVTKSGATFYGCNNYDKGCRFTIPAVFAGKNLNVRSIRELCTEKKTSVVAGFRSKAGRLFDARLRWMTRYTLCSTSRAFPGKMTRRARATETCPAIGVKAMRDFRSVPGGRRAIAVLAVSLAILFSLVWESEIRADAQYDQVCPTTGSAASIRMPDRQPIAAEISCRPRELRHGLMYRSQLPPDRGMLFVYRNPGLHQHWMRHCLIPLDIVWMDFHHRVREVMKSVPVCNSILPSGCRLYGDIYDAVYVLELAAGTASRHGLTSGDQLAFNIPHPENQ